MMRYYLRPLPPKGRVRQLEGKHLFLRSIYPPLAQTVVDGSLKAVLRIVREPIFGTERYPAAGTTRIDFLGTVVNGATQNGLVLTRELTNMTSQNQIGEPECLDWTSLSVVYSHGMPTSEINNFLREGLLTFIYSSSQPVFQTPLDQMPGSTGLSGVGHLFSAESVQVGNGAQRNNYSVTESGHPRRIWSQENFNVFASFRRAPVVAAARRIRVQLNGTRYIK